MKLPAIAQLEAILSNNSPAILTAVGVTGTVTTAVLAGKGAVKATDHIRDFQDKLITSEQRPMTDKETVQVAWRHFVPAAVSGALTVAAIIGANRIGARRAAGLAAAFQLSEKAYSEYKDKVTETIGENKERQVRDNLAQDRITKNPPPADVILMGEGTDVIVEDAYTGRYFKSNMEALRRAQNDFNQEVINDSYASLTQLYDFMGLPRTSASDEVGFTTEKLLDFQFSYSGDPEGRPCLSVNYEPTTIRNYWGS